MCVRISNVFKSSGSANTIARQPGRSYTGNTRYLRATSAGTHRNNSGVKFIIVRSTNSAPNFISDALLPNRESDTECRHMPSGPKAGLAGASGWGGWRLNAADPESVPGKGCVRASQGLGRGVAGKGSCGRLYFRLPRLSKQKPPATQAGSTASAHLLTPICHLPSARSHPARCRFLTTGGGKTVFCRLFVTF